MAWTGQTFSVGQILTAAQMTNLQNDITALANGDAGAPAIQTAAYGAGSVDAAAIGAGEVGQSEVAASAIGQGELKSTTASQSQSIGAEVVGTITPTGGTYTLGWFAGGSNGFTTGFRLATNGGLYSAIVGFANLSTGPSTAYLYSRYIQASPPWNLGNGDIPLFIMAIVHNKTKEVKGTYVAEDPPWYAHGPHKINANARLQQKAGLWGKSLKSALDNRDGLQALRSMDKRSIDLLSKQPLSMDDKNIDMNIIPHLFDLSGMDMSEHSIVMLDPVSDLMEDFRLLNSLYDYSDGESISSLLEDGDIQIRDELSGVTTPQGIIAVGARWR